jgi:predicted nuclease of predicted toxin-antitoxin system
MKILIDMNLSPAWVPVLEEAGHTASHWATIGSVNAPDREILTWAKANGYVLFTHDLDFGAILAATEAEGPSVVQIRAQDISPDHVKSLLLNIIQRFAGNLLQGALISVDEGKSRVRLLPLRRDRTEWDNP